MRSALTLALLVPMVAQAGPPFHAMDALPTGELVFFDPAGPRVVRWDGEALATVADVPGRLAKQGHLHNVWVVAGEVWLTEKGGSAWRVVEGKLKPGEPPAGVDVDDPSALLPGGDRVIATRASAWDVVERIAADGTTTRVHGVDAVEPHVAVGGLAALPDGSLVVIETRGVLVVAPDGTVAELLTQRVPDVIGAAFGAGGLHLLAWADGGVTLLRVAEDGGAVLVQRTASVGPPAR